MHVRGAGCISTQFAGVCSKGDGKNVHGPLEQQEIQIFIPKTSGYVKKWDTETDLKRCLNRNFYSLMNREMILLKVIKLNLEPPIE